jgi:hypothetical protein
MMPVRRLLKSWATPPADGLHLLRLAELLLEALALRHVAGDGERAEDLAVGAVEWHGVRLHAPAGAFQPDELEVEAAPAAGDHVGREIVEGLAVLGCDHVAHDRSGDLLEGVGLDHLQAGPVHLEERAVRGDELHALGLRLDDRLEEVLALGERLL